MKERGYIMTSGNNYAFRKAIEGTRSETIATKKGIGIKSIVLLEIVFITSLLIISNLTSIVIRLGTYALIAYIVASLANFVLQMIIAFIPSTTKALSIPYAISEGILIGSLVGLLELAIPGYGVKIGGLALIITVCIFFASSILYTTGIVKPNQKFKAVMLTILFGTVLATLILSIVSIFAYDFIYTMLYDSPIGIIIGAIMVIISGIYVVISLDYANQVADAGVDKKYEWYAAYGITINVVWLFLEVFRLLIIIYNRSNR